MSSEKTIWWYEEYGEIIANIVKYGNLYVNSCKKVNDFGTKHQLSLYEIQIIERVFLNENEYMKMGEYAETLGMTQSSFSKTINKLEKMGLIKKYHAENNKKDVFLRVTEEGKETYRTHLSYVYDRIFYRIIPIFQKMSAEQLKDFSQVLNIMGDFSALFEEEETKEIKLLPIDH